MPHQLPSACPLCAEPPIVTRIECPSCAIAIEGRFVPGGLVELDAHQLAFVEVFVRNRGVIRDVEAELGVSYPTVRGRLDAVAEALARQQSDPPQDRRRTLEALRRGEIDIDEAARHV
ncbi:MAG: DUF2089 domain-containing protein [Chloroflexota bacterium]|nr:DUF2089 domain-containing protein [Chloroflexota bacterium]MDE2918969.1 DUF2089 domain-containing protein [Chloroflexota bacterium]